MFHLLHGSLTPSAMATGQAAGVAASMALEENQSPSDISIQMLQEKLREGGAVIN
ncbi:FAD-dependent oxidoreductase [Geomicrobium sp. JCM 19039]|uniref:FAD-dependent oxidoreductase n=1 Tax=Geomicrobium sp. JCM 19039 TaxID=1460636 RepID=UPI001267B613